MCNRQISLLQSADPLSITDDREAERENRHPESDSEDDSGWHPDTKTSQTARSEEIVVVSKFLFL